MPKSKIILYLSLILAVFMVGILLLLTVIPEEKASLSAGENTKALIGGPFTLVDHQGNNVTHETFHGKYMLVYFGYTFCPDICPMELQIMSDALDGVPPTILADITPVFITVDPDRDTVDILAQYVAAFHPKMIGLTGSDAQIKAVKKAYKVYAAKEKLAEGADPGSYLLSHSSFIFLMDRSGEYITHFSARTDPVLMAKRLRGIVR